MKHSARRAMPIAAAAGMLCLILDSRHGAEYARQSLALCLRTVIPSLFPMFVLSGLLVGSMAPGKGRFARWAEKLLGLPTGTGVLFGLGLAGGFPVGAQCLAQSVESGSLSREDARRLLGLCNHCSPGFLFGILGSVFTHRGYPLLVALIHMESAILSAALWSGSCSGQVTWESSSLSLPQAVSRGIRSMTSVCAWVILAGVVTGFLDRWLFPLLPEECGTLLTGLLELTGGVLALNDLPGEDVKLIICCLFVCFGGVSVLLQIQSVASEAGISGDLCFRQKCVQGILGAALAALALRGGIGCPLLLGAMLLFGKKAVAFPKKRVYNSSQKGGI